MSSYIVEFLDEAKFDIAEISDYISDYSKKTSIKFINFLIDKINVELSSTPYMYREYFEWKWIRFIPHKWYVIFYRVLEDKKIVEIITVVHWARDLNNLSIIKK